MEIIRYMEKQTGVSAFSTLAGFNVCGYAGADPQQVESDLTRLKEFSGVGEIFIPRQTHSVCVARPGDNLEGVDALVTDCPNQMLCINTADCLPLLLYDPVARVIGAAHCGWRGTVGGIAGRTLHAMTELGARPEHIVAAIGPFISVDRFEVGPEVAEQFPSAARIEFPDKRPHVDLLEAVRMQLPGVKILETAGCSVSDSRFYSVRRQGRSLPFRTLSVIWMNLL